MHELDDDRTRDAELELLRNCIGGDRDALRAFEESLSGCLRTGASRVCARPDFVGEVVQEVRVALFTGPEPKALAFAGRGPLAAWLTVVATRAALDKVRSERRARARAEAADWVAGHSSAGPERRIDRLRHGDRLAGAVRRALAELSPRERNLLRLRYASGLNIDAIGSAYGVHRATVARWIASLLAALGRSVRVGLERELKVRDPTELQSALRGFESQMARAVGSFLGAHSTPAIREQDATER